MCMKTPQTRHSATKLPNTSCLHSQHSQLHAQPVAHADFGNGRHDPAAAQRTAKMNLQPCVQMQALIMPNTSTITMAFSPTTLTTTTKTL